MQTIVKWSSNWADEIDVEGFVICDDDEVEILKKLNNVKRKFDIYIGSNEEIRYRNGSELLQELSFTQISDSEVMTILKYVGQSYGHINFLDTAYFLVQELEGK